MLGRVWRRDERRPWVVLALATAWLSVITYAAFLSPSGGGDRLNLVPVIVNGWASATDAGLNALLFVPVGLLGAAAGHRVLHVAAGAFALSFVIEVTQYLLNDGRTSDVNDLIANTLGAAAGALEWHAVVRMTAGEDRDRVQR